MSSPASLVEPGLNASLQSLIAAHGYELVSQHLLRLAPKLQNTANAVSFITLSSGPGERSLPVAKAQALSAYEAETKRPQEEHPLATEPVGGDFHEYV